MKDFFLADAASALNSPKPVKSYFLVSQISQRDKKSGGSYLALTLADRTGSMEARMWEDTAGLLAECPAGSYAKVEAKVEQYQGKLQLCVLRMRHASDAEVDVADFQPSTQYDIDALWAELLGYVDGFRNRDLQRLVRAFLQDPELGPAFRSAPAAKMLHHAWIGGLLEHVVFLLRLCARVAPQYTEEVDPDLLMTGAILHDIGKVRELAWKTNFTYTTEGQLLGHITIATGMLRDKCAQLAPFPERLRILVEHMILSHHGKYEFGSPKLPMTPEALVFSALDDLEAKMQNMRAEFARAVDNGRRPDDVTEYSRSMERALLNSRAYLAGDERVVTEREPILEAPVATVAATSETEAALVADMPEASPDTAGVAETLGLFGAK